MVLPIQKRMSKEGIEKLNEDLRKKFNGDFGGVLLGAFTTISKEQNVKMLSLIFGTTTGGRNDFIIKQRVDFIEKVFEDLFETKFDETIIQVMKEGATYKGFEEEEENERNCC